MPSLNRIPRRRPIALGAGDAQRPVKMLYCTRDALGAHAAGRRPWRVHRESFAMR